MEENSNENYSAEAVCKNKGGSLLIARTQEEINTIVDKIHQDQQLVIIMHAPTLIFVLAI